LPLSRVSAHRLDLIRALTHVRLDLPFV
jgi:hypothetical protein